jgi:uncharacterized protein YdaU (DUF1376 family)
MYWDAYLADTTHLTTEEHGAYLLLLAAMWRRNGSVPDDDRDNARIVGLTPAKWRRTKARLGSLLTINDGEISQKNLQKIWKNTQEKIHKNRQNGGKGGRPKSGKNNDIAKANGFSGENPNETIPEPEPYPDYIKSPVSNTVTRAQGADGMEDENGPRTTGRSEAPDDGESGGMASAADGNGTPAGTRGCEPGGNGNDPWEDIRLTSARRDIARANGIAADEIDRRFADFIRERQASAAMVREPDEDWRRYCGKHGRHRSPNGTSAGGRSRAADAFREALARRQAQRMDMGRGDGDAAAWIAPPPNSEDDYGCGEVDDPVLRIVGGEG